MQWQAGDRAALKHTFNPNDLAWIGSESGSEWRRGFDLESIRAGHEVEVMGSVSADSVVVGFMLDGHAIVLILLASGLQAIEGEVNGRLAS